MKPIAISAGHLPDPRLKGAHNKTHNLHEHNIVYELAIDTVKALDDLGVEVLFVPTGTLSQKIAFINKSNCLCVVEIHLNSEDVPQIVSGTECLYWFNSKASKQLAILLQTALVDELRLRDRGLKEITRRKQDGGYFLRETNCPAVITESLFLNNDQDVGDWIIPQTGRDRIVKAHAYALKEYWRGLLQDEGEKDNKKVPCCSIPSVRQSDIRSEPITDIILEEDK